jgi:hypothetical protein
VVGAITFGINVEQLLSDASHQHPAVRPTAH